jgi:hypothetical protein
MGFVDIRMIIFEAVNNSQMIFSRTMIALSGLLLLGACSHDPFDVATDNVDVSVRYTNLDSTLMATDTTLLPEILAEHRLRIPDIIDYQFVYCFRIGNIGDPATITNLNSFKNEPYVQRLEKRIRERFTDLPRRHQQLTEAFRYVKAHLPKAAIPKEIVYLNSYFASSAFCTDQHIAIGLERYLGAKTDVIAELPTQDFFPWIKEKMDPQYLERDAVAAWVMTNIVEQQEGEKNIEAIIRWGKILYLTEAAFPEMPKHWIMRYTEANYQHALKNERAFWDYLVKQKLLFDNDERTQANLLNDGPFTTGLPVKGPDRLGQFLGWRIIHSYMEQYDVTLQQLMALPYTELLQEYEITD